MSLTDEAVIAALLESNMDATKAAQLLVKAQAPMASAKKLTPKDIVRLVIRKLEDYASRDDDTYSAGQRITDLENAMEKLKPIDPRLIDPGLKKRLTDILKRIAISSAKLEPLATELAQQFFVSRRIDRISTLRSKDIRDPKVQTITLKEPRVRTINLEPYPWSVDAVDIEIDEDQEVDPDLQALEVGQVVFTEQELEDQTTRIRLISELIQEGDVATLKALFEQKPELQQTDLIVVMPAARTIARAKELARTGEVVEVTSLLESQAVQGWITPFTKQKILERAQISRRLRRQISKEKRYMKREARRIDAETEEGDEEDDIIPDAETFAQRRDPVDGFVIRDKVRRYLEQLFVDDAPNPDVKTKKGKRDDKLLTIESKIMNKVWPIELYWAAHDFDYATDIRLGKETAQLTSLQQYWKTIYTILEDNAMGYEDVVLYFYYALNGEDTGLQDLFELLPVLKKIMNKEIAAARGTRAEKAKGFSRMSDEAIAAAQEEREVSNAWKAVMDMTSNIAVRLKMYQRLFFQGLKKDNVSDLLSLYMEEWKSKNKRTILNDSPIPETNYGETEIVTIQDVLDSLPWIYRPAFEREVVTALATDKGVPFGRSGSVNVFKRVQVDADTGEQKIWDVRDSRVAFVRQLSLETLLHLYWWQHLVFRHNLILDESNITEKVNNMITDKKFAELEAIYESEADMSRKVTTRMSRADVILNAVRILLGDRMDDFERNPSASRFIQRKQLQYDIEEGEDLEAKDRAARDEEEAEFQEAFKDPAERAQISRVYQDLKDKSRRVKYEDTQRGILFDNEDEEDDLLPEVVPVVSDEEYDDEIADADERTYKLLEAWAESLVQPDELLDRYLHANPGFEDRHPEARKDYLRQRNVVRQSADPNSALNRPNRITGVEGKQEKRKRP
jgi:hypothetical protein